MNTTNNKTSLYDSVKKNGRINMERNNVKDRLDTIPRGEILTRLDKFGEIVAIFIHGKILEGSGFFNPIIAYFPFVGWLKRCPSFELEGISTICFATQTEKEILFEQMKKEGYIWDGWNVIRGESAEEKEDEVKYELINKEGKVVNESPTEEEPSTNDENIILGREKKLSVKNNMKIARDILDNVLPYYVINDKMERLVRTTDESLNRDFNNFNYFTNKEDVDEAIRRVKETLMNFQEEIQNRK